MPLRNLYPTRACPVAECDSDVSYAAPALQVKWDGITSVYSRYWRSFPTPDEILTDPGHRRIEYPSLVCQKPYIHFAHTTVTSSTCKSSARIYDPYPSIRFAMTYKYRKTASAQHHFSRPESEGKKGDWGSK
jgi:hypothetical protein